MDAVANERRAEALAGGAGIADVVRVGSSCRVCAVQLAPPERADPPPYRDVDGLLRAARAVALARLGDVGPCPRCGRRAQATVVLYHAWCSAERRDLVVRAHRRLFGVELTLTWDGGEAARLGERHRFAVKRDAYLRAIRSTIARGGIRAALPLVEEAAREIRDPELLRWAPELLGAGRADLVERLATLQVARDPNDAGAHYWAALSILDGVNRRALPAPALAQAELHLRTALTLEPGFADADCALCQVARARRGAAAARDCLRRALERHPSSPRLLFELASLELARDAEAARDCFARGEAAAPDDAEFPLGQARALIALGRAADARAALERVRALQPRHPRLRELDARLRSGKARPPSPAPTPGSAAPTVPSRRRP